MSRSSPKARCEDNFRRSERPGSGKGAVDTSGLVWRELLDYFSFPARSSWSVAQLYTEHMHAEIKSQSVVMALDKTLDRELERVHVRSSWRLL